MEMAGRHIFKIVKESQLKEKGSKIYQFFFKYIFPKWRKLRKLIKLEVKNSCCFDFPVSSAGLPPSAPFIFSAKAYWDPCVAA